MATWLTHLRVAEKVKERIKDIDLDYYMAGSIAPDSGGKEITHFYKNKNEEQCIDVKCFYSRHLRPENLFLRSDKTRSFYWGYYSHLIVDNLWNERFYKPLKKKYDGEGDFGQLFKQEMEVIDFNYLEQNPQNNILQRFMESEVKLEFFTDFPPKLIYENIEKVKSYYSNLTIKADMKLNFLDMASVESFIDDAVKELIINFYK